MDLNDTNHETKTEFYTREGVWRLVTSCEYSRQQLANATLNLSQAQASNSGSSASSPIAASSPSSNAAQNLNNSTGLAGLGNLSGSSFYNSANNEPVRIALFKFSKNMLLKRELDKGSELLPLIKNYSKACNKCLSRVKTATALKDDAYDNDNDNDDDDDDDDDDDNEDIVCSRLNEALSLVNHEYFCKYCNLNVADANENTASLDLIAFNYSKEIYLYEFSALKSINETQKLIRKKVYKSFQTSCMDINLTASIQNTQVLHEGVENSSDFDFASSSSSSSSSSINNLSLIVAAGFNKGEIHLFDLFRQDYSVFYNNTKLVDKSKATCIKWLPKSLNLFLVAYSSGNIYLYDAYDQTQALVAPNFTQICQNDSFSIFINNDSTNNCAPLLATNSLKLALSNSSSTSSSSQIQCQVAKNPLLKLAISTEQNCAYGVNGVNDMSFSPCAQYLAVAGQDGQMRAFRFDYKNNQQMQIQLLCSMKSYFGALLTLCWSGDGKYIATGGEDDLITIFSFAEMRVVCRGRGHSSWINCVSFDRWTTLADYYYCSATSDQFSMRRHRGDKNEAKQEEVDQETKMELLDGERRAKISAQPKKRTISTLSDFHVPSQNALNSLVSEKKSAAYYRLASVGQDNQLCFWDLTEDLLLVKEKHSHSRPHAATCTNNNSSSESANANANAKSSLPQVFCLPQVIIHQASENVAHNDENWNSSSTNSAKQHHTNHHHHHHSTAISIVSSAKHLFSAKNSDKSDKSHKNSMDNYSHNNSNSNNNSNNKADSATDLANTAATPAQSSSKSSGVGSFFKRHKRNSSLTNNLLNSNNNSSNKDMGPSLNEKSASSVKNRNNSQVILNSYKKSQNLFTSLNPNDYGINSMNKNNDEARLSSSPNELKLNGCLSKRSSPFNLCPKLDEIPIIEPLICKRIANERLTSIVFREDCFLAATLDGVVYTWARPCHKEATANAATKKPSLAKIDSESKIITSTNL